MISVNKTHWPSLLILIIFGIGSAFIFLFSASLGIGSILDLFKPEGDPAGEMIVALAYSFEVLILLICAWFVLQRTMWKEQAGRQFVSLYSEWQILAVLGVVILSVIAGAGVAYTQIKWLAWFVLPILTILVIVPPIWLIFGIGTKGLALGRRWHVFAMLGLSMTIGPIIMIVLELVVLAGIIIIAGGFIAIQQPELTRELIGIGRILEQDTNPELVMNLVAPYFKNPLVIGVIIGYIAVIVPLIEELFKPLAVWIFAGKLTSPAQGFAMGMLSGGAFALIESLNASGDGTINWAFIVSVRAGTSLLHMTASALVGWGIVSALQERRPLKFLGAFFASVSIHGIWNACAAGISIASVGELIGKPEWLVNYAAAFLCGMLVLGTGMLAVLIASNRKLNRSTNARLLQQNEPVSNEGENPSTPV